jgi:3-hydroxyisobutyrate dehydrogenase-like beta-hydroxyacid dehydrogenase
MRVGVIGMGIMGQAMAARLLTQGADVMVHNRTREKAEAALAQGAAWADTPAALAAQCEVVLSIVTDPAAVAEISFGANGVMAALSPESVHADMSTVTPDSARQVAARYREQSKRFVQAPVLGSKRQIESGTLLVFGGGEEANVRQCDPAWNAFATRVWQLPTAEQAATTKLACNLLIAHMILGLGQSLLFAKTGGVDPALLLEVLNESALASPMYASKGKTLLERNFTANFFVRHMLKDLTLAAEAGQQSGVPLLHNAVSRELFAAAERLGWGDEDYSAVVKVLENLAAESIAS